MRLYHCAEWQSRPWICENGLVGRDPFGDRVFAWETLPAAHAYRFRKNLTGWADIWSFDDAGLSIPSEASGEAGRQLYGTVPRDRLTLEYRAEQQLGPMGDPDAS